jgi:hypothetical protein
MVTAAPVRDALRHVFLSRRWLYDDKVVCPPRGQVFRGGGRRGFNLERYGPGRDAHRQLCGCTK